MPFSKSQVYAGLGQLELLRMVKGTEVPQQAVGVPAELSPPALAAGTRR